MPQELKIDTDLVLRYPHPDAAREVFTVIEQNRECLEKWLPWVATTDTEIKVRTFLRESLRFNMGGQKLVTLLYYQNTFVGVISAVQIDTQQRFAEIGYWIGKSYGGKGFATKAVKRLLHYLFKTTNVYRIVIRVSTENERSIKIPERLHFTREGTLRCAAYINNSYQHQHIYSLLKPEWKSALNRTNF